MTLKHGKHEQTKLTLWDKQFGYNKVIRLIERHRSLLTFWRSTSRIITITIIIIIIHPGHLSAGR